VWLIGAVVCLLAAPLVMDDRIMRCDIISSCQLAAISDIFYCKALLFLSLTHVISAVASVQTFNMLTFNIIGKNRKIMDNGGSGASAHILLFCWLSAQVIKGTVVFARYRQVFTKYPQSHPHF